MFDWTKLSDAIPTIISPTMRLSFREKAKWTLIILFFFYVLGQINVWGVNQTAIARFEFLEIVFGSRFGSLITLGIGPIVTASIILQLLVGSGIINWDTASEGGRKKFNSANKILAVVFCLIEAIAYVLAGAVPPATQDVFLISLVILQLTIGGLIIIFMDEVVSKWGFGSGVSLFIAAGVARTILLRTLNPFTQAGTLPAFGELPAGIIPGFIASFLEGTPLFFSLLPLLSTIIVFLLVVYIQEIRIEIPMAFSLPFGKFAARRWPLKLLYTSNIPVILTGAIIANLQVFGKILFDRGISILGIYDEAGQVQSGLMFYLSTPSGNVGIIIVTLMASIFALLFIVMGLRLWKKHVLKMMIVGAFIGLSFGLTLIPLYNLPSITMSDVTRSIVYMSIFIIGSIIFSIFWVHTSGMDSHSVAEQFRQYSIMIPGFRHDPRIIEKVLDRYIPALTVLGGAFVGFLAAFSDLTSALGTGTGILLSVMIVYQLYEQITSQHREDIPPVIRKFLGE
jgi:preprotein translocase subunit SecY